MNIAADPSITLLDFLREQKKELIQFLTNLVESESPSQDPQAQVECQRLLAQELEALGYRTKVVPGKTSGGQLMALPADRPSGKPIQLLIGHSDTVWPHGTLQTMPIKLAEGRLHGPGVYDMKAGLTQAVFAVKALHSLNLEPTVAPVFFINSDEEIGSFDSKTNIIRLSKVADRAFVVEPGLGISGKIKTSRKGVGRFNVKVIGKASHAGLAPEEGISAILELSHVVQALFALNDPSKGITVNVGTIDGGLRPNVVAPEASAQADVRVATHEDARAIEKAIHGLQSAVPGTRLEITGGVDRPPMEKTPGNQKLWESAKSFSQEMGIAIDQGAAGGGSDGNFTSLYTPTLDGMGAVGDGAHAVTEFVFVEHLAERSALLARLLLMPALNHSQS